MRPVCCVPCLLSPLFFSSSSTAKSPCGDETLSLLPRLAAGCQTHTARCTHLEQKNVRRRNIKGIKWQNSDSVEVYNTVKKKRRKKAGSAKRRRAAILFFFLCVCVRFVWLLMFARVWKRVQVQNGSVSIHLQPVLLRLLVRTSPLMCLLSYFSANCGTKRRMKRKRSVVDWIRKWK